MRGPCWLKLALEGNRNEGHSSPPRLAAAFCLAAYIQLGGLLDDQDWNIWVPLSKNVRVNQQDVRVWHFYSIDSPQL